MTESSQSRRLVTDMLSAEERALGESGSAVEACGRVLEHLRRLLQPLLGKAGYEMLLARAAVRGARLHDVLAGLEVTPGQPVNEKGVAEALGSARDPRKAAVTLLGEMLDFLAQLVGWRLTLRVLEDEWPDLTEAYDVAVLEESTNMSEES